jgi:hypothetical protein
MGRAHWAGPLTHYSRTGRAVKKHEKKATLSFWGSPPDLYFSRVESGRPAGLAGWPIKNIKKNYKIILVDFGKRYTRNRRYIIVSSTKC